MPVNKATIKTLIEAYPREAFYQDSSHIAGTRELRTVFNGFPFPGPIGLLLCSKLKNDFKKSIARKSEGQLASSSSIPMATSIATTLEDLIRTRKILEEVEKAVEHKAQQTSDVIHVVDAGCGAIPILGIYAALCHPKKKIQVTCIENNKASAKLAREIVKSLGLQKQIKVVTTSATEIKPDKDIDILISETVNNSLMGEAYLDIMYHLSQNAKDDCILIPESVDLDIGLVGDFPKNTSGKSLVLYQDQRHFPDAAKMQEALLNRGSQRFSAGEEPGKVAISIPLDGLEPGKYNSLIYTGVNLGPGNRLELNESNITLAQALCRQGTKDPYEFNLTDADIQNPGSRIDVSYEPCMGYNRSDQKVLAELHKN